MANYEAFVTFRPHLFALPMHIEQIFYCNDNYHGLWWKVVLWKKVRGKRVYESICIGEARGLFNAQEDVD